MDLKNILTTLVDMRHTLRILKSDIGYHFELLQDDKLIFGSYFKYGEKIHKIALCIGGAVYGLLHDDELSEAVMKVIYNNINALGWNEFIKKDERLN